MPNAAGSSPLTRGKRWRAVRTRCACRLIPAHAGKTARQWTRLLRSWAHPRSRGENEKVTGERYPYPGSSPLTRGKPSGLWSVDNTLRLIPAHAGKTATSGEFVERVKAHPRSRGENGRGHWRGSPFRGSSPLTRGKHDGHVLGGVHDGLIPAHAGKTGRTPTRAKSSTAHPRSRGENRGSRIYRPCYVGSSPLTRGKLAAELGLRRGEGLIPAHAGKTRELVNHAPYRWAHPRSRGENHLARARRFAGRGSSPLTRGKRGHTACRCSFLGLIPAHAGKTNDPETGTEYGRAHPRSRGENLVTTGSYDGNLGSSPLTRGKHDYPCE